jgi:hypothetical protein
VIDDHWAGRETLVAIIFFNLGATVFISLSLLNIFVRNEIVIRGFQRLKAVNVVWNL